MTIKLADAERIVQAGKKKAEEMGIQVVIAVVDPRGDLVTLSRMDGAPWRSLAISQGKAHASVEYGVPSADLADRANKPVMNAIVQMKGGVFVPQQGAVPIKQDGQVVGAVGVSGASSKDDETVALAGVAAL